MIDPGNEVEVFFPGFLNHSEKSDRPPELVSGNRYGFSPACSPSFILQAVKRWIFNPEPLHLLLSNGYVHIGRALRAACACA